MPAYQAGRHNPGHNVAPDGQIIGIEVHLDAKMSEVEPLVEKLSRETHLYLWFVGD